MSALKASPLHLISGLINTPLFHRELKETPAEVTIQCIRLLARLGGSEEVAYQTNREMVTFLSGSTPSLDDETYTLVTTHFVTQLQTLLRPQDPIWGAVAVVMTSVAVRFSEGQDREVWTRLCARFFDVLRARGVINEEQAKRFLKGAEEPTSPTSDVPEPPLSAEGSAIGQEAERARMEAEERKQQEAALTLLGGGGADYAFERRLKPR